MKLTLLASIVALPMCAAGAQSIRAVRIQGPPPRMDGRLTEPEWRTAPAITGFLQREPDEGSPAPEDRSAPRL
jgi:hypothetical protein